MCFFGGASPTKWMTFSLRQPITEVNPSSSINPISLFEDVACWIDSKTSLLVHQILYIRSTWNLTRECWGGCLQTGIFQRFWINSNMKPESTIFHEWKFTNVISYPSPVFLYYLIPPYFQKIKSQETRISLMTRSWRSPKLEKTSTYSCILQFSIDPEVGERVHEFLPLLIQTLVRMGWRTLLRRQPVRVGGGGSAGLYSIQSTWFQYSFTPHRAPRKLLLHIALVLPPSEPKL